MKKVICLLCLISLSCFFCSCTNSDKISTDQNEEQNIEENTEKNAMKDDISSSESNLENASDESWRQFLKDYEAWTDEYIAFLKKYKENPTDTSLISDYAQFAAKSTEWAEKARQYQDNLKNTSSEFLKEYAETISKITSKIANITY